MTIEIQSQQQYFDQLFEKIQLEQSEIHNSQFSDCVFSQCSLTETVFRSCRFNNCSFKNCDLSLVRIPGSSFPSTRFVRSKLIGINWTQANWETSGFGKLLGFSKCGLSHGTFIGLNLEGVYIKNCVAIEVDFREANLTKVDFSGTDLDRSIFNNTDLTEADLSRARNYQINPTQNTITQARFSLPEAIALIYNMDIDLIEDQEDQGW